MCFRATVSTQAREDESYEYQVEMDDIIVAIPEVTDTGLIPARWRASILYKLALRSAGDPNWNRVMSLQVVDMDMADISEYSMVSAQERATPPETGGLEFSNVCSEDVVILLIYCALQKR
jgi:hypothetical protein